MHGSSEPSPWVARWAHLAKRHGTVLDLACGHGRHLKFFAAQGHSVLGVDRSEEALKSLVGLGELVVADLEADPWPLIDDDKQVRRFDAVVVTNYLWRSLFPLIAQCLAPGGVLIYETFASGNESVGKPSRPDFLLQPGELLQAFSGLRVVAYEDGFLPAPARFVQRLAAVREPVAADANSHMALPARYPLPQDEAG